MRDHLLSESLKRLAADAAVRLGALVAEGAQIPFDVAERDGEDSAFYLYEPQTARFVREHEQQLRDLPTFLAARDAVEAAGVAAGYLEARGEAVPGDPRERAAKLIVVFLAALWESSTEFALDRERLDTALAVLDAEARNADDADVLIAPIVGLRMAGASLELPHGVRIVRADAVDVPAEAMRSDGMGRSAWEPQFLALAEKGEGAQSAEAALRQLRGLISVMRIFKPGGVGLGPHAFAPTGEGSWARVPTGAPATRPGGYRLSAEEAERLAELAAEMESRPEPGPALTWAVGRFEMGCARESALEGLSDHLLALRAVLEGGGPVGATPAMRAAALLAPGGGERGECQQRFERALDLERSLMSGEPVAGGLGLAVWVEEGVRRILREAALGELGSDLGTAAEESLIAAGLAEGDAQISVSAITPDPPPTGRIPNSESRFRPIGAEMPGRAAQGSPEMPGRAAQGSPEMPGREAEDISAPDGEAVRSGDESHGLAIPEEAERPATDARWMPGEEHMHDDHDTRIMEPVPGEDEIRITATNWLDEVSDGGGTIEWASAEGVRGHRERIDSPRVRHLFPVPEDADWQVRELDYDHYTRRAG